MAMVESAMKNSSLAVVVMVKNEALAIADTLNPFLKAGVTHFLVLDTGSTDDTVAIAKSLLATMPNAHVIQEPFVDFATSRNRALVLAEEAFPNIPFLLMLDAEWHCHEIPALLHFCDSERHSNTPLYLLKVIMNRTFEFYVPRLFRTNAKARFEGVVHEVPTIATTHKVPECYITYAGSETGIQKTKKRWERDLALLKAEHQKKPQQPRTVFYLAQTYECLGNLKAAYRFYLKRAMLTGFDEELFITHFRLGGLAQMLSQSDKQFTFDIAKQHYETAFGLRPHRIEPLVKLADYYWPNNVALCYLYAKHACDTPFPIQDLLFIEKEMYAYTRYEILSRCAWYMGDYQKGLLATKQALVHSPNTPHLLRNLQLYQKKMSLAI